MAAEENKIIFRVVVDDSGSVVKLKSLKSGVADIDLTARNTKTAVDKLSESMKQIGGGKLPTQIKLTAKEIKALDKEMQAASKSTGAAAATTLELGRVISDAPYGIRGMANNVSQIASQMAFMSNKTDAATGKAIGFGGALKLVKAQILGPLGILLAVQAVIAALDFFVGGAKKAGDSADEFKIKIEELTLALIQYKSAEEGRNQLINETLDLERERIKNTDKQTELAEELNKIEARLKNSREDEIKDLLEIYDIAGKSITRDEAGLIVDKQRDAQKATSNGIVKEQVKSQEEYNSVLQDYVKKNSGTAKGLDTIISLLKKTREATASNTEEYAIAGVEIEEYQDKLLKLTGQLNEVEKAQRKVNQGLSDDRAEALEDITDAESDYFVSLLSKYDQEKAAIEDKYFYLIEQAKKYSWDTSILELARQKEIDDIEIKGSKKKRDRVIKEYKQQLLDLEKFILNQKEQEFNLIERNEWKRLQSKQEFEKKDLVATRDAYLAKNKVRFDNFIEEAEDEDAKNRARAEYREANGVAKLEFDKGVFALENKQIAEDNEFKRALEEKHLQSMAKLKEQSSQATLKASQKINGTEAGSVGSPVSKTGAEGIDTLVEAYKAAGVIDDALFEEGLAIKRQQLKDTGLAVEDVNAQIFELKYQNDLERVQREIDLEQMKIDAKRNINQEYISWVSGLSGIFKGLAGENEALATAALVLEKGAAISGIIVQTQAANAKISAGAVTEQAGYLSAAAQTAASLGGGPQGLAAARPYTKLAGASAIAAKGRILKNNVGSGISIAKILATTLQSRGGGGGSGGGGGGGAASQDRTFDFNLVGNTGVNQLAQGIAGQFSGPIQAYVVASQVTSQQQLDATIQSNATIG